MACPIHSQHLSSWVIMHQAYYYYYSVICSILSYLYGVSFS